MPRPVATGVLRTTALLALAGLALSACGKDGKADGAASGATKVKIEMTDAGCAASPASIPAGPATFEVTNTSANKVTEAELLSGGNIVGEKENLTPGLSGTFSLRLDAGSYTLYCPNAATEKIDFKVTGSAQRASKDPAVQTALDQAVTGYQQYVIGEVDKLVPATHQFTDAVRAGNIAQARTLYAPARYFYEEVEPVAESFGDLDPDIDARLDDVDDPSQWTGFHRLEKALWADNSLAGLAPVADKLDADIAKLKARVATAKYQPAQLANGATELLNEVASRKITGEEDRYSHTDLSDFEANVVGGKKAYDLLVPALQKIDPQLTGTLSQRFTDVLDALKPYQHSAGVFVDYSTVADAQRRVLTQKVDALAEPLSQVAAKVTG
jgi:iron uptake system component EfeO